MNGVIDEGPVVVGVDLSLVSTGFASSGYTEPLRPKKMTGYERLRWIRDNIAGRVLSIGPNLVVVEGPSLGSIGRGQHERAGLWWMVTEQITSMGYPLAVAPPSNIKKYATGKGGGPEAGKDYVLAAAVRRFPWFQGGNDEADALWACAMGYHHLGRPIVEMPKSHYVALDKCDWPEEPSVAA